MENNTQTDKLAPRIIINENEINDPQSRVMNSPITLMFGFAPIGRTCEMVVCNSRTEIANEFGFPETSAEKYFIDSANRIVDNGATVLMTRLPYDNMQSHEVKYTDFMVHKPIAIKDIATGPMESKVRENDDGGVDILKDMNSLDPRINQYQRITQVRDEKEISIGHMTYGDMIEMELNPEEYLGENIFRIVDIRDEQYGSGSGNIEYTGIFPIITTSPMALYYQMKLQNSEEMDENFKMVELDGGIEMSTSWYRDSEKYDEEFKIEQSKIVASIRQQMNFNSTLNRFHRANSFQDECARKFPLINMLAKDKIDNTNLKDIGLLVCRIGWDYDQQITTLSIVESFVGKLGKGISAIERKINSSSKFIRMYSNLSIPIETDYFVCDHQKITSIGMQARECQKWINYKTSIIDPITFMLENTYSDVDSVFIDTILDCGLSSIAFASYVAKNSSGETFVQNPKIRTKIDWQKNEYSPEEHIQEYAYVWNEITNIFGNFIKNVRGDCVYIADGPRILNLTRNYPIRNYTDMDNIEMFNKFLPYFNDITNNYVARYWNWVYIEDMQYDGRGIWVPGSVVMGSQLAYNDGVSYIWFAPAGQQRGLIGGAYDVSVKTKQYNQENDLLYQNQWNFFNVYQNEGIVAEGQKTLQQKKTSLDRLNTRRMVCWIKQQIRKISNRYKYEPHTKSVRDSYARDLDNMLMQVKKTYGISDYTILCNESNNTTETIDRHELHCKIGIKPIKAIEYIVIDLDIINGNVGIGENTVIQG